MKLLTALIRRFTRTCGACGNDPCSNSTTDCPSY